MKRVIFVFVLIFAFASFLFWNCNSSKEEIQLSQKTETVHRAIESTEDIGLVRQLG